MKLITTVLLVVFWAGTTLAADDTEFRNSGEFRMRYFHDFSTTGRDPSGQRADTTGRFKFNIAARKGETLNAYLSVIHRSQFGSQNTETGEYSSADGSVNGSSTTASTNNLLLVNRAWGAWKASETLSFKVGRFGIAVADGLVFSENQWEDVPTAHEGLEAAFDMDFAKFSFFFTKTNELTLPPTNQTGAPNSDPERNLHLATLDLKNLPDAVKTANLHFVLVTRDASETSATPPVLIGAQNWQHVGLTLGGDFGSIIYKLTGAYQVGSLSKTQALNQKLNAHMYDAMLGYYLPDSANFKFAVGYHVDSGNKADFTGASDESQRYQTLYYDRHDTAGLMDFLRWGNLTYWNVDTSFMPSDDFEMGARVYLFSQTKSGDPAGSALGERYRQGIELASVAANEQNLGSEVDAYGTKFYDGGFKVGVRLGAFMPGSYFKNGTGKREKPIIQGMFQGSFEF